jgi:hypothetical protein
MVPCILINGTRGKGLVGWWLFKPSDTCLFDQPSCPGHKPRDMAEKRSRNKAGS